MTLFCDEMPDACGPEASKCCFPASFQGIIND